MEMTLNMNVEYVLVRYIKKTKNKTNDEIDQLRRFRNFGILIVVLFCSLFSIFI